MSVNLGLPWVSLTFVRAYYYYYIYTGENGCQWWAVSVLDLESSFSFCTKLWHDLLSLVWGPRDEPSILVRMTAIVQSWPRTVLLSALGKWNLVQIRTFSLDWRYREKKRKKRKKKGSRSLVSIGFPNGDKKPWIHILLGWDFPSQTVPAWIPNLGGQSYSEQISLLIG